MPLEHLNRVVLQTIPTKAVHKRGGNRARPAVESCITAALSGGDVVGPYQMKRIVVDSALALSTASGDH